MYGGRLSINVANIMITTLELISEVNGVSEDEPNCMKGVDFWSFRV